MFRTLLVLAAAAFLFAGCTKPPYYGPDKTESQVMADYTDCYSKASLEANTPPYPDDVKSATTDKTNECMTSRGYKKKMF